MHLWKCHLDTCSRFTTSLVLVIYEMAQDGRGSALLSMCPVKDMDLNKA